MVLVLGVTLILGVGLAAALRLRNGQSGDLTTPAGDPAMRACPACGHVISVEWDFCPFCARALAYEESTSRHNDPSSPIAGAP